MADLDVVLQRRLYVGGLFSDVQADQLREKFSRFGSVNDIEIKLRRDENGSPAKTFAYLSIYGNKKDYDKCFSTFHKAKWKGSVMVLQNAKDNFLARLQKEREEAAKTPDISDKSPSIHEPLKQVMRGAVPGTPVPGEKDWVVGKYGRVLPIVNIKKPNKKNTVRVDPSKLCHNLKRLKDTGEDGEDVSVDSLTWDIQDGDTDITKKRKGEFPDNKKSKAVKADTRKLMDFLAERNRRAAKAVKEANDFEILKKDGSILQNAKLSKKNFLSQSNEDSKNNSKVSSKYDSSSNSDRDSADTDEIIAAGKKDVTSKQSNSGSDSDAADVTADSFVFVSAKNTSRFLSRSHSEYASSDPSNSDIDTSKSRASRAKASPLKKIRKRFQENPSDSESSDSDDDSSCSKNVKARSSKPKPSPVKKCKKIVQKHHSDSGLSEESDSSSGSESSENSRIPSPSKISNKTIKKSDSDSSMSNSDSDGDGIESSSFVFLPKQRANATSKKQLKLDAETPDKSAKSPIKRKPKTPSLTRDTTSPSEADVSASETNSSESDDVIPVNVPQSGNRKGKPFSSPIPEFKGRVVLDKIDDCKNVSQKTNKRKSALKTTNVGQLDDTSSDSTGSADTDELLSNFKKSKENITLPKSLKKMKESGSNLLKSCGIVDEFSCGFLVDNDTIVYKTKDGERKSSDSESEDYFERKTSVNENEKSVSKSNLKKEKKERGTNETIEKSTDSKGKKDTDLKPAEKFKESRKREKNMPKSIKDDVKKPRKELSKNDKHEDDNRRRLETLQERRKEVQSKKDLVQKALSQVDSGTRLNKKIVFDSDDEGDALPPVITSTISSKTMATREPPAKVSNESNKSENKEEMPKKENQLNLFDSSDSSDSEDAEDDHDKMFRIRRQYEGEQGKRLMDLQSRFGNDDRFKIDERFIDSDEEDGEKKEQPMEEEGESERSRTLRILEDVVGRQPVAKLLKQEFERKTFKDTTALHFDPTREDHSEFEVKLPVKEKGPKKKKSKESAQTAEPEPLPEVSKERSYEVEATAFQDVFSKQQRETTTGFSLLAAFGKKDEDVKDDRGKAESTTTIKTTPGLNPWEDRFYIDSSDDSSDDNEESKTVSEKPMDTEDTSIPTSVSTFFFLNEDDPRLKEGITYFKRPEDFEAVVEKWKRQRPKLLESYKEKLKKAAKTKRKQQQQKTPMKRPGYQGSAPRRNTDR